MSTIKVTIEIPAEVAAIHINRDVPLTVQIWPEQMVDKAASEPQYTPHALDLLIVATLQLDGAQTRAQIVAAIEGETYTSRRSEKTATEGSIKRRVAALAAAGAIKSTPSGYIIGDSCLTDRLDHVDFGSPIESTKYEPHPLDVLIFAAIEQGGPSQAAELLAALERETYKSKFGRIPVTASALKRRLPDLKLMRAITTTPAGYAIADTEAVKAAEQMFGA